MPTKLKSFNVIEDYRDEFYSSACSEIDFHKYYHHLNSSQALCINLFFPLIVDDKLFLILDLLDIPRQPIKEARFEKESDVETGSGRKTNFDFYICLADNTKIYFEIKYTEAEFGKAKNDPEHRFKFTNTYEPLLKNNPYVKCEYSDVNKFLDSYQIMRNLCHINGNSFVVFVYPKANKRLICKLNSHKKRCYRIKEEINLKC